jgi:hypothetical protein
VLPHVRIRSYAEVRCLGCRITCKTMGCEQGRVLKLGLRFIKATQKQPGERNRDPVPANVLKLDQAYIAVGGRDLRRGHLALIGELDIMRPIALRISPRGAEVLSSTQSATCISCWD